LLHPPGASHRIGIEVERVHPGAQPPGRETEESAPRADVEKCPARQTVDRQHLAEGPLGLGDSLGREPGQELLPVSAKGKPLAAGDFRGVIRHRSAFSNASAALRPGESRFEAAWASLAERSQCTTASCWLVAGRPLSAPF